MKDTIRITRERERGSEKRRRRGRESEDGHKDMGNLEPLCASSGFFCPSTFGRQMTSGRTCDMLSCGKQEKKGKEQSCSLHYVCLYVRMYFKLKYVRYIFH